jgi:hypothetical protein
MWFSTTHNTRRVSKGMGKFASAFKEEHAEHGLGTKELKEAMADERKLAAPAVSLEAAAAAVAAAGTLDEATSDSAPRADLPSGPPAPGIVFVKTAMRDPMMVGSAVYGR